MKSGGLDQYKRLIRFAFNILLLGCLMYFFIRIWDANYNDGIVFPFYYKGFWMMGAFYALFFVIFSYILGGMKIGYLKSSSLMLSQTLALLAANISIYLETVLLSARFVNVIPMVELTAIAIQEQDEVAACARMALLKLKCQPERLAIADEVLRMAAVEEEKAEPDPVVFHNGCLLLYDLQCETQFSQYTDRYANLIEQAYGLDKNDLTDMKKTLSVDP